MHSAFVLPIFGNDGGAIFFCIRNQQYPGGYGDRNEDGGGYGKPAQYDGS